MIGQENLGVPQGVLSLNDSGVAMETGSTKARFHR